MISNDKIKKDIESWTEGIAARLKKAIIYQAENPICKLMENHALDCLKNIEGELHIIGLSPFNDNHLFESIDLNVGIRKIIYYYYGKEEVSRVKKIFLKKDIVYRSVKDLWCSLI